MFLIKSLYKCIKFGVNILGVTTDFTLVKSKNHFNYLYSS